MHYKILASYIHVDYITEAYSHVYNNYTIRIILMSCTKIYKTLSEMHKSFHVHKPAKFHLIQLVTIKSLRSLGHQRENA